MNLTIGITCYYGTKLAKLINQINSLFDSKFTPSLKSLIEPSMDIVPNEKIELIFVIDTYEIRNKYIPKKYTQTYEENINNILTYIKSLKIYNTKISIFKTDYNSGVSVSRNIIINNAKSKFICFCDDDDLHINVNETLKIIHDYPNYNCINCFMSKRKNSIIFEQSNISPCSGIYKVDYLRKHNLYFPEGIKSEDIIWRSKLYKQLSTETKNNIIEINTGLYIALEPSNSSTEIRTKANLRYPNGFYKDNYVDIPTNQITYDKINTIKITNYNEWDIFALTSSLNLKHGYSLIYEYTKNNIDKFNQYNKKIFDLVSSLKSYQLDFKHIHDKNECFRLYLRFITLQDMKYLAEYISDVIKENRLETFNALWKIDKYGFDMSHDLKLKLLTLKILDYISDNEINLQSYKNFCFRYACLKYLQHNEYKENLGKKTIKLLNELKTIHDNNFKKININDVVMYLNYNYEYYYGKPITVLSELKSTVICCKNKSDLSIKLKTYFEHKYDLLIDRYIADNSFETLNIFSQNYKGFITNTLIYILSPKLITPINDVNNQIKCENTYKLITENDYSGWFNWLKYITFGL